MECGIGCPLRAVNGSSELVVPSLMNGAAVGSRAEVIQFGRTAGMGGPGATQDSTALGITSSRAPGQKMVDSSSLVVSASTLQSLTCSRAHSAFNSGICSDTSKSHL